MDQLEQIYNAMTPTQARRFKLYNKHKSYKKVAKIEKVSKNAVYKSVILGKKRAFKKLGGCTMF